MLYVPEVLMNFLKRHCKMCVIFVMLKKAKNTGHIKHFVVK